MLNRKIYSVFAWVTVVAFISMLVIKDYHGLLLHNTSAGAHSCCCHHSHSAADQICVLDGKPVTSAQVYACICRYPSIFTKEAGRICVML